MIKQTKPKYDLSKSFVVNSICREDLVYYMSKKKAIGVEDAVMQYIANKMADAMQVYYSMALEEVLHNLRYK